MDLSWTMPNAGESLHSIPGWEWTRSGQKRVLTGSNWIFNFKVCYPKATGLVFAELCKRLGVIAGLDLSPVTKWTGERSH